MVLEGDCNITMFLVEFGNKFLFCFQAILCKILLGCFYFFFDFLSTVPFLFLVLFLNIFNFLHLENFS